jgi:hypothetical protein
MLTVPALRELHVSVLLEFSELFDQPYRPDMRPRQPGGKCPQSKPEQFCNLSCKYNFFEAGELVNNS